ncbi:MAG: DNA polymerase III subunit delta' [Acidobacteria bacterium]|nr:DNA polymerase III subunit delta' [Acidobacteriota bacterium]MBV9146152.1 DNA polymerase III subunit delta' [Acidobacteriota bacterium]MBV9436262.1 DNA polymerase III subunit delta' [Acidobacteriota bacterium]
MPFADFVGNRETVDRMRGMIARDRFPHSAIIAGPEGAGKYTLAQMIAKTLNCLEQPQAGGLPDFCGRCSNCTRIAQADDLDARFAEAVEARENMREADKRDARILIQTHPEVLIVPPDPPQMLIKVGQVRQVIDSVFFKPVDARRKIVIFTESSFMKEAANSLLKVLEEPPEYASLLLLTTNPGQLLPTIRSRCVTFTLGALPASELEGAVAAKRKELKPAQRELIARLANGAVGRALAFNVEEYVESRSAALTVLQTAVSAADHSEMFKLTETYRAGAEGRDRTDRLLRTLYALLEDMLLLKSGTPELVRNIDIKGSLARLSEAVDFDWIVSASERLAEVERGMRRNLLRSLSIDAFAVSLER